MCMDQLSSFQLMLTNKNSFERHMRNFCSMLNAHTLQMWKWFQMLECSLATWTLCTIENIAPKCNKTQKSYTFHHSIIVITPPPPLLSTFFLLPQKKNKNEMILNAKNSQKADCIAVDILYTSTQTNADTLVCYCFFVIYSIYSICS